MYRGYARDVISTCHPHIGYFEWQKRVPLIIDRDRAEANKDKCVRLNTMGKSCCAVGCVNRYAKGSGIHFYRFPEKDERRARWIAVVGRKNWKPNEHSWICSAHFVSGAKSNDPL